MSLLLLFSGWGWNADKPDTRNAGSSISGGTFSRKRWHNLLDKEEAEREAALAALALKRKEQRELALKKAQEEHAAFVAEREDKQRLWEQERLAREFQTIQQQSREARAVEEMLQQIEAKTAAARAAHAAELERDEDEAIALLLLSE